MAFTHVEYRIDQARRCDFLSQKAQLQIPDGPYVVQDSNIACDEPVSIATKDAGNSAADSLDVGEQTSNITPNNAASSNNMIDDDDNLAASADDSSNNDSARGTKRLGSQSDDEMPGHGITGGPRVAPSRNSSARKAVAMLLEQQHSPALESAKDRAAAWLEGVGISGGSAFRTLLEKSTAIASGFAQQQHATIGRKRSVSPVAQTEDDANVSSFWSLSDKYCNSSAKDCSSSTGSSDNRYKSNRQESRYFDALKSLFQTQSSSVADRLSDNSTLSNHYDVTIDECRYILENNCGAIDLLTRYFSKLVEIFYSSPVRFLNSQQLMRIAFNVANTLHEPFLGRVHCMLSTAKTYEDHNLAIRYAAFMLLAFTNGLIESTIPDAGAIGSYIRGALIRLVGDATTILGLSTDDPCVLQYQFVEAWTSYETGI
ncbi:hypothetical protein GGI23_004292, partial [Coemansia sp. RSA 2559]